MTPASGQNGLHLLNGSAGHPRESEVVPAIPIDEMSDDSEGGLDLWKELEQELGTERPSSGGAQQIERLTRALELARAYFQMRLYDEAVRELERSRELGPMSVEAQWLMGQCHFRRGDLSEAIRWYQNVLNRTDLSEHQELEVLFELGLTYEAQGEHRLALDLLQELAGVNPKFREKEVQDRIADNSSRLTPGVAGTQQTAH